MNLATGNGNGVKKCLKTMFFEKNFKFQAKQAKFFKASRALWQKVANFCHRKRKWGPKMLKNHVF